MRLMQQRLLFSTPEGIDMEAQQGYRLQKLELINWGTFDSTNGHVFTVNPSGQTTLLVGRNGCGKSTLFDLLIGLEHPTAGRISIGDKTPYDDFDAFRGKIATIFQQDRLLPWRSALDNVKLPLELIGISEDVRQQRAMDWLRRLADHRGVQGPTGVGRRGGGRRLFGGHGPAGAL